jgi:hypothetical protein
LKKNNVEHRFVESKLDESIKASKIQGMNPPNLSAGFNNVVLRATTSLKNSMMSLWL